MIGLYKLYKMIGASVWLLIADIIFVKLSVYTASCGGVRNLNQLHHAKSEHYRHFENHGDGSTDSESTEPSP